MGKKENSALNELMESIQYAIDSKKGKYSLETYLEIIGEYADRTILKARKSGLMYTGGDCKVKINEINNDMITFSVKMYFRDSENNPIIKEASRDIASNKFTKETICRCSEEMMFSIEEPQEERE